MRISKGYWIWGLFSSKEKVLLDKIKDQVQSKLKSPFFETHLTLTGPYNSFDNIFLNNLRTIAGDSSAVMLNVDGYDHKQEKFESFYITIKNTQDLKKLRRKIYELNNFDKTNNYSPHISLSYGNHEKTEKKELILKLPELNKPIKMSKIALVEVDEDINLWNIVESFDLN